MTNKQKEYINTRTSGESYTSVTQLFGITKPAAYTKCDVQLIKVAPDDGLTESETCRESNGK